MMRQFFLLTLSVVSLSACKHAGQGDVANTSEEQEDREAKRMLQGIWTDGETGQVSMRADGDTIFYPDSTLSPTSFRVVGDSLCMGSRDVRYHIVAQSENVFAFENQNGEVIRLMRSNDAGDSLAFAKSESDVPEALNEVKKTDSIVQVGEHRLHWYIAINPTHYRVSHNTYNDEGVAVEKTFYDNIIHLSVYEGRQALFSQDIKKSHFQGKVPKQFLQSAVLGDMQFDHADAHSLHFFTKLCIPDDASCYLIDTSVSLDGKLTTKVLDY